MASCTRIVPLEIIMTTSPVVVSLSKNAISCLNMLFMYRHRIRAACLSPVVVQLDTSEAVNNYNAWINTSKVQLGTVITVPKCRVP